MVTGDLERAACEMLIQKLIVEHDCKIQLFLSDRHRGILLTILFDIFSGPSTPK